MLIATKLKNDPYFDSWGKLVIPGTLSFVWSLLGSTSGSKTKTDWHEFDGNDGDRREKESWGKEFEKKGEEEDEKDKKIRNFETEEKNVVKKEKYKDNRYILLPYKVSSII